MIMTVHGFHGEKVVNGSTATVVITRESGLRQLSTFTFRVRAYSGYRFHFYTWQPCEIFF